MARGMGHPAYGIAVPCFFWAPVACRRLLLLVPPDLCVIRSATTLASSPFSIRSPNPRQTTTTPLQGRISPLLDGPSHRACPVTLVFLDVGETRRTVV